LIYPAADTIEDKVGSRYSLVILAAKRAKQIKEGAPVLIDTASTNPLTIALEEIAAGKVTVNSASITPRPESESTSEGPSFAALVDSLGLDEDEGLDHDDEEGEPSLLAESSGLDLDADADLEAHFGANLDEDDEEE
jgi:DNA-directed RNA polymerase subunit omega